MSKLEQPTREPRLESSGGSFLYSAADIPFDGVAIPFNMFDRSVDYDPERPLEDVLKTTPAKWVVYLFTDAEDQPVQLLCVKNLRASLKRRLGGDELIGPTRKVNYRELVRHVYWRRVD